jgi:4-hydroxythreonine-4-phosphate dehydrogenase
MAASPLKICITTGDQDGIGVEVSIKALEILGPQSNVHFLIWRGRNSWPKSLSKLKKLFTILSYESEDKALAFFTSDQMKSTMLVEIVSEKSPALWVQQSAIWCSEKIVTAMVTGPISKTEIYRAGLKDMGHTDILKRISQAPSVHMGFLGEHFNVLLATAHIPLSEVPSRVTEPSLQSALIAANMLRLGLKSAQQKLPIAWLGMNPHAGEEGLIGGEESALAPSVATWAKKHGIPLVGPLVPDAAFLRSNWRKYSVYVTLYHDQGLIPFKLVHGQDSGVHVSVGLPFVRTSVDHGTAKDIFAKNRANPASMLDAIRACIRMTKSSINK